jgi:hypothetical protein
MLNSNQEAARYSLAPLTKSTPAEHDFSGNAKEEIARLMDVFGANGHIVETWYYDEDQKVNAIRANTYEFDATGNWTVQKSFEKQRVKGEEVLKPISTSFRTIIYYE